MKRNCQSNDWRHMMIVQKQHRSSLKCIILSYHLIAMVVFSTANTIAIKSTSFRMPTECETSFSVSMIGCRLPRIFFLFLFCFPCFDHVKSHFQLQKVGDMTFLSFFFFFLDARNSHFVNWKTENICEHRSIYSNRMCVLFDVNGVTKIHSISYGICFWIQSPTE